MTMRTFALRLHPGQDLRVEVEAFAAPTVSARRSYSRASAA